MNYTLLTKGIQNKVVGLLLIIGSMSSCTEVPPFIDYSPPILLSRDTTYIVNTIPAADDKNVLIEDISGVRCVNCPAAAEVAHDIKDKYPDGRVVVLTLHSNKFSNFTRPFQDTFNTEEATLIVDNLIGSPQGLPNGSVDRKVFSGNPDAVSNPNTWSNLADQQLSLKSDVNLELELIKDANTREVIANVKATFLKDIPDGVYLSVFISESHILSSQLFTSGVQEDFEHNFILRKGITNYTGLKLADQAEPGRVFEKGFEFKISDKWDFEHCSVVVMVNKVKNLNNDVLQVVEQKLAP